MGGAIEVVAACWLCLASVSTLAMGVPGMVAEAVLAATYAGCAANYRGPDHRRELLGRAGVLAPHRDHHHVADAQFATRVVRAPDFSPGRVLVARVAMSVASRVLPAWLVHLCVAGNADC